MKYLTTKYGAAPVATTAGGVQVPPRPREPRHSLGSSKFRQRRNFRRSTRDRRPDPLRRPAVALRSVVLRTVEGVMKLRRMAAMVALVACAARHQAPGAHGPIAHPRQQQPGPPARPPGHLAPRTPKEGGPRCHSWGRLRVWERNAGVFPMGVGVPCKLSRTRWQAGASLKLRAPKSPELCGHPRLPFSPG